MVQVCDLEVTRAFEVLSIQDPAGDNTLVQENDLEAWRVAIETDYGSKSHKQTPEETCMVALKVVSIFLNINKNDIKYVNLCKIYLLSDSRI